MPYFSTVLKKVLLGYTWVNAYVLEADSLGEAHAASLDHLVGAEAQMLSDLVVISEVRTSGIATSSTTDFLIDLPDTPGERDLDGNALAVPFAAVYVKLASSSGRPGKKFYRYCLLNSELRGVADGSVLSLDPLIVTAWEAAWEVARVGLVSDGSPLMMGYPGRAGGPRGVSSIVVAGAAQLDVHHGWFNKGT